LRAKELPPGADELTSFLKSYIATWAGRAGVLSEGSSAGKFYNPAASIVLW